MTVAAPTTTCPAKRTINMDCQHTYSAGMAPHTTALPGSRKYKQSNARRDRPVRYRGYLVVVSLTISYNPTLGICLHDEVPFDLGVDEYICTFLQRANALSIKQVVAWLSLWVLSLGQAMLTFPPNKASTSC